MTGFTDMQDESRALTVRSATGRPLLRVGLGPGIAAGLAAILVAPRAAAVAAIGCMFRGVSLTVDRIERDPASAAA